MTELQAARYLTGRCRQQEDTGYQTLQFRQRCFIADADHKAGRMQLPEVITTQAQPLALQRDITDQKYRRHAGQA